MLFVLDKPGPNLDFNILFFSVRWKLRDLCELKDKNAFYHETRGSLEFYLAMHKAKCTFYWQKFYLHTFLHHITLHTFVYTG